MPPLQPYRLFNTQVWWTKVLAQGEVLPAHLSPRTLVKAPVSESSIEHREARGGSLASRSVTEPLPSLYIYV